MTARGQGMDKRCCETDEHDRPMLICAPPEYANLRAQIQFELDDKGTNPFERQPLLIGIDGVDGAGKSSLASWLAWQFKIPAVYLDTFMVPDSDVPTWRTDDLRRLLDNLLRAEKPKPIIVEGICLLEVLKAAGWEPDFLIFIIRQEHEGSGHYAKTIKFYSARCNPMACADYTLTWRPEDEHDA
jgi:hypothetical protein